MSAFIARLSVGKPLLTVVQFIPLFVDRKTPLVAVPAKRFVPMSANALTFVFGGKPLLVSSSVQFSPLFEERKTAKLLLAGSEVDTKRFVPLTIIGSASSPIISLPAGLQSEPLFVEIKTPA